MKYLRFSNFNVVHLFIRMVFNIIYLKYVNLKYVNLLLNLGERDIILINAAISIHIYLK